MSTENLSLKTPFKTSEHIVAYLDMLGAKSRTKQDQDATLNEIHDLYSNTIKIARDNCLLGDLEGIKIKIFSDNVIVAKELSSDSAEREESVSDVLWWCTLFQNRAISGEYGWLVRGGITIDNFYLDDLMVWGKALLTTVDLEEKTAKDPKIVIDTKILPIIREYKKLIRLVEQDDDGKYILNFMDMWPVTGKSAKEGFEKIISATLPLYDDDVYKKLRWHMNYVNKHLDALEPDSDQRLVWF